MSYICWNCKDQEIDNKVRSYQIDGKIISGTRNFCSDKCEKEYQRAMSSKHPQECSKIILVFAEP